MVLLIANVTSFNVAECFRQPTVKGRIASEDLALVNIAETFEAGAEN